MLYIVVGDLSGYLSEIYIGIYIMTYMRCTLSKILFDPQGYDSLDAQKPNISTILDVTKISKMWM